MIYGIFSDIHGNLEALRAVLSSLESIGVDSYLCLGDIVGFAANPNECVSEVRKVCSKVIAGNHDWAAVGFIDVAYLVDHDRTAAEWTQEELNLENGDFIKGLELSARIDDPQKGFDLAHASLVRPQFWDYVLGLEDARTNFHYMKSDLLFIGHSHQTTLFTNDSHGRVWESYTHLLKIEDGCKYIVNVGSVGQPRDRDPRSAYVVYDSDKRIVELRRVDYDIGKTQGKIIQAKLPSILAERLSIGY